MSQVLLLAHMGHWASTVAYLVPVVTIVVMLLVQMVRGRRRARGESTEPDPSAGRFPGE